MTERIPQIRTSERVLFKRCQRAWWWGYREGLVPKRVADPLWFGSLVHVALANWYCGPGAKRGPHPAESFTALADDSLRSIRVADATEEQRAQYVEAQQMGVIMLNNYVDRYGRDEQVLMIAPEQTFSFEIPFPDWWGDDARKLLAIYVGTFDGAYRDAATGQLKLWEHKTAKTIRLDHLPLDEQGGSYWAIATRSLRNQGLISEKEKLAGITYNFLRKALPDPRPVDAQGYACNKPVKADFVRALGYADGAKLPTLEHLANEAAGKGIEVLGERSKSQPGALFHREEVKRLRTEQRSQLLRIQTDAVQMEMARRGEIPITKTPHFSCRWCDFYDMCRLEEASGNWTDLRSVAYRQENPYADHTKSADEDRSFDL